MFSHDNSPTRMGLRARRGRRGAVTIFVAFALIGILGVVAIAVDGGILMDKRRHAQATADSVALAAADILYSKYRTYKGRDEDGFEFSMEWVRRHDQY